MVGSGIEDAWNHWTDFPKLAGVYGHEPGAGGHETIGSAVDAYVVAIPGLRRDWADLNAEELEDIRDVLMSYLHLKQGTGSQ